jgi:nucleoside-diphosphate-sugar epimerase
MNEDFNLSSPTSTTVLELAELIWKKVKGDVEFRFVSDTPFEHDVACRIPATEKAARVLGFEAATSLSDMLDEVIPWIARAIDDGTI